ncbi:MAG: spore coat associated protein CotJA [Clostridia bacterium]|nr:spore coat associated protein CotJA [Clostridia bacterium]
MYSDTHSRSARRRTNDEFLRHMVGGNLTGNSSPVCNPTPRTSQSRNGTACNGSDANAPGECPVTLSAPSLAMVYSPRQCWRNLLDPHSTLENGSLFAELVLPLEVVGNGKFCDWGVNTCK